MTSNRLRHVLRNLDPRRSLMSGTVWLVIVLAASFALAASLWVGGLARDIVLQQHVRRLRLETEQLSADVSQAVEARLAAIRAVSAMPPSPTLEPRGASPKSLLARYEALRRAYPDLDWIGAADASGRVIAGEASLPEGSIVAKAPWFSAARRGPWIGVIGPAAGASHAAEIAEPAAGDSPRFGDLGAPLEGQDGALLGVIAAHLDGRRGPNHLPRLTEALGSSEAAQAQLLVGAPPMPEAARFERLADGRTVLTARASVTLRGASPSAAPSPWQVQLSEPSARAYERADALAQRILWISLCLGALTACLGALGARQITRRLKRLTLSASAVGRHGVEQIEVPGGHDEVAQLAAAFARILEDLRQERAELRALSTDLERRVAVRTREVLRLAEESRYAAIVRERLKIARDLHDTLAHSMMAMLSEIRLLRRLQTHDPNALPEELARAEEVAQQGLNEARTAITQMRVNAVRDTGLGPALAKAFERFLDRTGLTGEFAADPEAARFGDERAEAIFRTAEEALRNIERHAMARHVRVSLCMCAGTHLELRIADDGVGFDPEAPQPGHYGLLGLREQAHLIGAELQIESRAQVGTTLRLRLRVAPEIL
jgi:signal transduction histidine kinase